MKNSLMLLLVLLAVTTFGCNDDNNATGGHEIGDSCNDNYFFYACNNDRSMVVECNERTNGIVKEYEKCANGTHCATFDNDFFHCYGDDDKCDKLGEITHCGISLIQPEIATIQSCLTADDGNKYIYDTNNRYCAGICQEGCYELSCNQGDASYCSDNKLIAYNCIANDFAALDGDHSEYVISAQQCTQTAPCQINSAGKAECTGE